MKLLKGITVINLGYNLPGPLAAYRLAKLGASVIKVEPPQGDPLAEASPDFYKYLTKRQTVLRMDLKDKAGRAKLNNLLKNADLLITSSKPESLARMNLSGKSLKRRFPKLCVLNIVGFSAPDQNRAGHDLTYQAEVGLVQIPQMPRTCTADISGANEACLKSLELLFAREKFGRTGHVQISLSGSLEPFTLPIRFGLTSPNGPLAGGRAEYNIYRAKSGWVAVALLEPHFQAQFKEKLGLTRLNQRVLKKLMLTRTATAWQRWAESHNLPIAAVTARRLRTPATTIARA